MVDELVHIAEWIGEGTIWERMVGECIILGKEGGGRGEPGGVD